MTEAPRWRLMSAHYLNVQELSDGTRIEWEHKETARETGRTVRRLFPVPMLLNPQDPADHNYPGEIIVASEIEGTHRAPRDIVFRGEPTQEMEPLNEAAQAITDSLRDKWINPIETLPANGGMNTAEMAFMQRMMETFSRTHPPAANTAITEEAHNELKERLAKLEAMIASQNKTSDAAPAVGIRRP